MHWHIVTGEYPPQPGGVSDYTRQVARGLVQAGDAVVVWAPESGGEAGVDPDVDVRRLPGRFGQAARARLERGLAESPSPRRVLVQYVPHAFGWKGGNLPFCAWLRRLPSGDLWVMFHEVMFPVGRQYTAAQNALGATNRVMARLVAGAATRVFVSVPAWADLVAPLVRPGTPVEWLPVPSGIPVAHDPAAIAAVRRRYAADAPLVGHFGTFGRLIRPLVDDAVVGLLGILPTVRVLLVGRGSAEAADALRGRDLALRNRIIGTGALDADQVSAHLRACDVLLQPFPDGVSTRRTSAMAALAHGIALVTTQGQATEAVWIESGVAALAPAGDARALALEAAALVGNRPRRLALGAAGCALYDARFAVRHVIERLRA